MHKLVSIQLVSPARGELADNFVFYDDLKFPFNWFPLREGNFGGLTSPVKSCRFPFNWFPLREGNNSYLRLDTEEGRIVSIQLVSPARGELPMLNEQQAIAFKFPFNWFPLREGNFLYDRLSEQGIPFPFNWFPLREGNICQRFGTTSDRVVSIQLVSPARGEHGASILTSRQH